MDKIKTPKQMMRTIQNYSIKMTDPKWGKQYVMMSPELYSEIEYWFFRVQTKFDELKIDLNKGAKG